MRASSSSKRSSDVQVVGDLVGLDADERALDPVHGAVEVGRRDARRRREARAGTPGSSAPRTAASGRPGSPTAATATRAARARRPGRRRCAGARRAGPARTARGRPRGSWPEERRERQLLGEAGGESHVSGSVPQVKGWVERSWRPASRSKPRSPQQPHREVPLPVLGNVARQERVSGRRRSKIALGERHEVVAQPVQQRLEPARPACPARSASSSAS